MPRVLILVVLLFVAWCASSDAQEPRSDDAPALDRQRFDAQVRPFLVKHCAGCHGEEKQKAELNLLALDPDTAAGADAEMWNEVLEQLVAGSMPPKDRPRPDGEPLQAVIRWLNDELERARRVRASTGGHVVMRRLSRTAYNYALQDLTGLKLDFTGELPPDAISPEGFDNHGQQTGISSQHFENYLLQARYALDRAIVSTPRPAGLECRFDLRAKVNDTQRTFAASYRDTHVDDATGHELTCSFKMKFPFGSFRPVERDAAAPEFPVRLGLGRGVDAAEEGVRLPSSNRYETPYGLTVAVENFRPQSWDRYRLRIKAWRRPTGSDAKAQRRPARMQVYMAGYRRSGEGAKVVDVEVTGTMDEPQEFVFVDAFETHGVPLRNITADIPLTVRVVNVRPEPEEALKMVDGRKVKYSLPDEYPYPELMVTEVEFTAPYEESWPPASHVRIMQPGAGVADESARAGRIIDAFAARAFGRPCSDGELEHYTGVYQQSRDADVPFMDAVKTALSAVLCSPDFLYLVERAGSKPPDAARRIDANELARRLALFLWCSIPDDELRGAAASGKLLAPAELAAQVDRMLADPKASRGWRDFVTQWLELERLDEVNVNSKYFADVDADLLQSMRQETLAFYESTVRDGGSLRTLFAAPHSFLNERLAQHYGLEPIFGHRLRKVALPASSQRAGLLGHASLLTLSADGTRTNPILRGAWFLRVVLNDPPPPPPPVVPTLEESVGRIRDLTLKEKLARHRDDAACMSCHARIDPWGFPFEQFDAVGRWRTVLAETGNKERVDAVAVLDDDTRVEGMSALRTLLLDQKRKELTRGFVEKLLTYALGRSLEFTDQAVVEQLVAKAIVEDLSIRDIYREIATGALFQTD